MDIVATKPKFQDSVSVDLGMNMNFEEGDIIEDVRIDDGILFKVKLVVLPQESLAEIVEDKPSNCFRPFPSRGGVVTNELIDKLRNEVGD